MPNRLANETSPYLLQHAENPVDWYPWGDEALRRARDEDKPLLVSIGYSACHWCHVMERESFQNEHIAEIMNREFISIKVDREERPDLDAIFMAVVESLTGGGGWPLNIFLTPDGRPYYGGTYFPPSDRSQAPGFSQVLQAVADAYRDRPSEVDQVARQIESALSRIDAHQEDSGELNDEILDHAYQALEKSFDSHYGGFGLAPKFPQPAVLEFLLRYWHRSGEARALEMVEFTLEKMASGGIYDQLGGGYHRYATDNRWVVPHFEKMLYDNALLVRVYLQAHQLANKPLYRRIVEETLDYVLREMTSPLGGFYSSQDADTEGVEGKYYTLTEQEMAVALKDDRARIAKAHFGVGGRRTLKGRSVLHISGDPEELARQEGMSLGDLAALLSDIRRDLFKARERRIKPGRDEKILAGWNALMLGSFAEAGASLGSNAYLQAATRCAEFLQKNMANDDVLFHTWKDKQAKIPGFLEDYASMIEGLLSLHGVTHEDRWLQHARSLGKTMLDSFWDSARNTFFDASLDQPIFLIRPRSVYDGAMPSGSSMATLACLRLSRTTAEPRYEKIAIAALRSQASKMGRHPLEFGNWLCALDFYLKDQDSANRA